MNAPNSQEGFSLIELLATLAVVAITLTLGIPGYRSLVQDNRLTTDGNLFTTDVYLARSEAVKRARNVAMCVRNTAGDACLDSTSWKLGWLVFVDSNANSSVDTGDEIIRVREALPGSSTIYFNRKGLAFGADGFMAAFGGTLSNGTVSFCDSRGVSKAKGRVIATTGRLRQSISTDTLQCP